MVESVEEIGGILSVHLIMIKKRSMIFPTTLNLKNKILLPEEEPIVQLQAEPIVPLMHYQA